MADRVSEMTLELNPQGQIQRILLDESDGSETEFVFSRIQENIAVEDARFRFQPPPGVELIEGSSVTP
jgi:outer membrane lipoprotein-sorting protein